MAEKIDPLTDEEAAADLGLTGAELQTILAAAYSLGFQECANWWEIHHFETVMNDNNPWTD